LGKNSKSFKALKNQKNIDPSSTIYAFYASKGVSSTNDLLSCNLKKKKPLSREFQNI